MEPAKLGYAREQRFVHGWTSRGHRNAKEAIGIQAGEKRRISDTRVAQLQPDLIKQIHLDLAKRRAEGSPPSHTMPNDAYSSGPGIQSIPQQEGPRCEVRIKLE